MALLENDLSTQSFDNVKNLLVCALQLLLILVYLVIAECVVDIVWGFRAH